MKSWEFAYIIFIVIMLTYMVKFEYLYTKHKQKKIYSTKAKILASHAIVVMQTYPELETEVRKISFLANQSDTSKDSAESYDYYTQTQSLYNRLFNLPTEFEGSLLDYDISKN